MHALNFYRENSLSSYTYRIDLLLFSLVLCSPQCRELFLKWNSVGVMWVLRGSRDGENNSGSGYVY